MLTSLFIARYKSPLAMINIASSDFGVLSLDFGSLTRPFAATLKERYGPDIRLLYDEPSRFRELFSLFDSYFNGSKVSFDLVNLDLRGTPFERRVWAKLKKIPPGSLLTYVELARLAGSPRGARAVGGACARNPVPLIVGCHRVISSTGRIGGYSAGDFSGGLSGVELKKALLKLEGVSF